MRHHKKKIAFLFSAMRHFAVELRGLGWTVEYVALDAAGNRGSFTAQLGDAIARHRPARVVVTEAGEGRVRQMQASWSERFALPWTLRRTSAPCARRPTLRDGRRGARR